MAPSRSWSGNGCSQTASSRGVGTGASNCDMSHSLSGRRLAARRALRHRLVAILYSQVRSDARSSVDPTLEGNPWNCPHRPGAGRSPFAIAAAGGAGERANHEEEPMHGKAATHRQRVRRTLARVFAGWRTGLPGPVLVLQAGTAVNYFGTGLILPFEIIYLHQARGFPTATAGLVLAAIMGTAAVVTPLSGALLDRFRAKPILITGNLASALGYAAFAFVDRPWQAFVCAAVGGAGFGLAGTPNQVLTLTLVSAEHRASSIALRRVAGNFGLGSGATVAGFIVAFAHDLRAFQALYLFDGVTFAVFALVVLVGIPNPRLANAASASDRGTGFRAVAHDRLFLILIAANIVLVMTGGALFSNILAPFATAHTPVGPGETGVA